MNSTLGSVVPLAIFNLCCHKGKWWIRRHVSTSPVTVEGFQGVCPASPTSWNRSSGEEKFNLGNIAWRHRTNPNENRTQQSSLPEKPRTQKMLVRLCNRCLTYSCTLWKRRLWSLQTEKLKFTWLWLLLGCCRRGRNSNADAHVLVYGSLGWLAWTTYPGNLYVFIVWGAPKRKLYNV